MEKLNSHKTDEEISEEYFEEATKMVNSKFNKKKVKQFTEKWIQFQIDNPNIVEEFETEELENLKSMGAEEVREEILKHKNYSCFVKKYHTIKKAQYNKNNLLTWSRFEEPLRRASEIESQISSLPRSEIDEKFPLLGYVMSIKDSIYLKGAPSTCGLFLNLDKVATEDPIIIQKLKSAGAVMTSKGNVPMVLFSPETINNLYGESKHPLDDKRTVGGSSGGEAGLVASGINNCSIGTDIAGSLRIPSLFCGTTALKPGSTRVSSMCQSNFSSRNYGSNRNPSQLKNKFDKQFVIKAVIGPMARKVADLEKIMEVICRDQSFDLTVPPIPWRHNFQFKKRVAVLHEMSLVELGPTAKRALEESKTALRNAGYELVDLDMGEFFNEVAFHAAIVFNKNKELFSIINGTTKIKEPLTKLFDLPKLMHSMPNFILRFVRGREGKTRKAFILDSFFKSKQCSQQQLFIIRNEMFSVLHQKMVELDVSAILSPGIPIPAVNLYSTNKCMFMCCYMFIWNFFDMPSGVLKVTEVKEDEQFYESLYVDEMTENMKQNMVNTKGLPMGVSVTGRPFQEEVVLKVMRDIEDNLG